MKWESDIVVSNDFSNKFIGKLKNIPTSIYNHRNIPTILLLSHLFIPLIFFKYYETKTSVKTYLHFSLIFETKTTEFPYEKRKLV